MFYLIVFVSNRPFFRQNVAIMTLEDGCKISFLFKKADKKLHKLLF